MKLSARETFRNRTSQRYYETVFAPILRNAVSAQCRRTIFAQVLRNHPAWKYHATCDYIVCVSHWRLSRLVFNSRRAFTLLADLNFTVFTTDSPRFALRMCWNYTNDIRHELAKRKTGFSKSETDILFLIRSIASTALLSKFAIFRTRLTPQKRRSNVPEFIVLRYRRFLNDFANLDFILC